AASREADRRNSGSRRTTAPTPAAGSAPSLAALLHVALHELLGVLFQHGVDLVQDVVHLVLELGGLRGRRGLPGIGVRAVIARATALALRPSLLLLFRHRRLLVRGRSYPTGGSPRNRSGAQASYQRGGVLGPEQQVLDVLLGSPEGLAHRYALQGIRPR